jgi:hypothetical protein
MNVPTHKALAIGLKSLFSRRSYNTLLTAANESPECWCGRCTVYRPPESGFVRMTGDHIKTG